MRLCALFSTLYKSFRPYSPLIIEIRGFWAKIGTVQKPVGLGRGLCHTARAGAKWVIGVLLKKSVVLVGMMGAGKTAVGTIVARKLAVPFCDSDEEIVQAAGESIADIFARDGEAFFRARESEVIARLLRGRPCILSTGGGAFLAPANRALIGELGLSVWLDVELEVLWQRVRHKTTRPLLRTENPRETLAQLLAQRLPSYAMADISVQGAADISAEDMAERVIAAIAARPDVLGNDDAAR